MQRDRNDFIRVMEERRGKRIHQSWTDEVVSKPAEKFRQPQPQHAEASDFEHDPEALEDFLREQAHSRVNGDSIFSGIERAPPPLREEPDTVDDSLGLITEEGGDSDTATAIRALLGKGDLRTQTELDKEEVRALSVLLEVSDKFGAMRLEEFAKNFMALMVSHQRGSRREVVQSFSGLEQFGRRGETPPSSFGGLRPPSRL